MNLIIDARFAFSESFGGIRNFSLGFIRAVIKTDEIHQIYLIYNKVNTKIIQSFVAEFSQSIILVPVRNYFWAELYDIPKFLFTHSEVVSYFGLGNTLPFIRLKKHRYNVVIHDAMFLNRHELLARSTFKGILGNLYRMINFYCYRKSFNVRFFTVSSASADEISQEGNIPRSKIHVGYQALHYLPNGREKVDKENILLCFGSNDWRKNLSNTIDGYLRYKKMNTNANVKLHIIGIKKDDLRYKGTYPEHEILDAIIFHGKISDQDKSKLLSRAKGLMFLSKSEGFGIPILEGFSAKALVFASNIEPLREIGGDACVFCDPNSISDIAEKLLVLEHERTYNKLIGKGVERLDDFSWDKLIYNYIKK